MNNEIAVKRKDREDFVVRVIYHEHSTWQGEIIWAGKQEKRYFRSALELLMLINNALEGTEAFAGDYREWA